MELSNIFYLMRSLNRVGDITLIAEFYREILQNVYLFL